MHRRLFFVAGLIALSTGGSPTCAWSAGGSRFAHSESDARYIHVIDLYDADNRKITPESTKPYSSIRTCGRCHDVETIAHGWHFNAFTEIAKASDLEELQRDGRVGEPWIWTDARTATQLPLSYRSWPGRFDPKDIGITRHAMTKQFGGRVPGGGFADPGFERIQAFGASEVNQDELSERWAFSGGLEIDCMVCHAVSGAYNFEARREVIADENFAWAPTAGLGLGEIKGDVSRIRDGSDPTDESVLAKLPQVTYDPDRFDSDGRVHMDLVLEVDNNACYQCHSHRQVDDAGVMSRWRHDEDVHLLSGMQCIDCHRNGIGHDTVRGFEGESHPAGESMQTLSCVGCHLGGDPLGGADSLAGRFGSPVPAHAGIPPVHFDLLTCTACHGGPLPGPEALGWMTSLSHSLGEASHRTGAELPWIQGPVYSPLASDDLGLAVDHLEKRPKITAARVMWPTYWASVSDEQIKPLPPDEVFTATRRALRVRKDFMSELVGDEPDEEEFAEKVAAGLRAIEKELEVPQAAFVTAGRVHVAGEDDTSLEVIPVANEEAVGRVTWPLAHNVRPAGWSLGVNGCTDCHAEDGLLFSSSVTPVSATPSPVEPIAMATLQGIDAAERERWNQLFGGRTPFKVLVAASLLILMGSMLIAMVVAIVRAVSGHAVTEGNA
ncbi:MAG: hypothetical protein AAGD07_24890 [Planctomycetota bacterium]